MTDHELMRALFAEGIQPAEIAVKFEVSVAHVQEVLGIDRIDPRAVRTYQRFWKLMGEAVMTSAEVAAKVGKNTGYANSYLRNLEDRGQAKRIGGQGRRRRVLWQMVKIEQLLPSEAA